jgi:replicative DNA helicase
MTTPKLPPHNLEAEEAVNGSLLIDGRAIYQVVLLLKPEDFFDEANRIIYQACLSLYSRGEAIDQVTVAQELERWGKLEKCGGSAYLSHLVSIVPTPLDAKYYAQIVYRLSVMRQLIIAAGQIADIGYRAEPDLHRALNQAEETIFQLRQERETLDFTHIKEILDQYFEPPPQTAGHRIVPHILSGFYGLDELLGGFQRSDLIIVAGRPSMGKTSFALNIARNAAVDQAACVAIFSLEMSCENLVQRLISSEAGVESRRIRLGHNTEQEEEKIMEAQGILSEAPIYIDDSPQQNVMDLATKARRLNAERGVDLIIIDYLQLIQGNGRSENRVQEIGYISRALKALARELDVPVIAVSQLSRAPEWRASHIPQLSDLRESGSIEQDADVVIFIYRDEVYYNEDQWREEHPNESYPRGLADIIVAKHRNGPLGQIKVRYNSALTRFENLGRIEPSLI